MSKERYERAYVTHHFDHYSKMIEVSKHGSVAQLCLSDIEDQPVRLGIVDRLMDHMDPDGEVPEGTLNAGIQIFRGSEEDAVLHFYSGLKDPVQVVLEAMDEAYSDLVPDYVSQSVKYS